MRLDEFLSLCVDIEASDHDLVAVIDKANAVIYTVTGFTVERHDDADGSQTVWLEIEES